MGFSVCRFGTTNRGPKTPSDLPMTLCQTGDTVVFQQQKNKRIASSDASLPKGDRRSRGLLEEPESGTVLGTTLRRKQQPMRWISWAASLCLPLPVDKKEVDNWHTWSDCFATYAAILVTKYPNRAAEMFQYMITLQQLAVHHDWTKVYAYDRAFRSSVEQNHTKSWAHLDQVLFGEEVLSMSATSEFKSGPDNLYKKVSKSGQKQMCKKYSQGLCTFGTRCWNLHKYLKCGKFNHMAKECRRGGNERQLTNVTNNNRS